MKRMFFAVICMLTLACCVPGLAEAPERSEWQALLDGFEAGPYQWQTWGDTAACFVQKDGKKALCVLEKQGGAWKITVCNGKALRQDLDFPRLFLDSDQAIFWDYALPDHLAVSFSCRRETGSSWERVSETIYEPLGQRARVYLIDWREDKGGEIVMQTRVEDENENLVYEEAPRYLPAAWLRDCVTLADFDVERFPSMGSPADDYFGWPGQNFFREAAAWLMPEYTYLNGVLRQNEMHFLMQKPAGEKVYVVCDDTFNPQEISLIESSPLPEGAVLGVENFTDCLGWEQDRIVSIQNIPRCPWCGLESAYGYRQEGFLRFGRSCVFADENEIYVGSHPWANICAMDWSSIPMTLSEALPRMDAGNLNLCWATVSNPNPADRLNLREKADKGSPSLGKYYNGTPVKVYEIKGDWAKVEIGGQMGWMMKKYLTMGQPGQALLCDTSAMPQLMPRGEGLRRYEWPEGLPYDTVYSLSVMKVIGIVGTDWYHVWFPITDEYLFVRQADLWEGNG